jgi:branched-chain amino acid transport system substrate-binding protein
MCVAALAAGCSKSDKTAAPTTQGPPTKTLTIVSDLPLEGSSAEQTQSIVRGIELYLDQIGHQAGPFSIEYESVGIEYNAGGHNDPCVDDAEKFVADERIVAVVGPFNSGCAKLEVPIGNPHSLAYVSPSNTAVGLTHEGPGSEPGEPDKYYPTGVRTYARMVAADDVQGRIGAGFMAWELGVTEVFVLDDSDGYGRGIAAAFEAAAADYGMEVVGRVHWNANSSRYTTVMQKIKASGADGIYIGGISDFNGDQVLKDKVAVLGGNDDVKVLVSDGFVFDPQFVEKNRNALEGVYGTTPTLDPKQITGAGEEFVDAYEAVYGKPPELYTAYAVAAAQVLLDAIARSDGTRGSVLEELRGARVKNGILGDFRIDRYGDITPARLAIFRITGATPPGTPVFPQYEGAVFDRVIEVPEDLVRP